MFELFFRTLLNGRQHFYLKRIILFTIDHLLAHDEVVTIIAI